MILSEEFKEVDLNDKRLNQRLVDIGNRFLQNPDKSIPYIGKNWAFTKACYRFFNNEKVSREKLLQPHFLQTKDRCENIEDILIIQDTTTLSYNTHKSKNGLGPINTRSDPGKGMLVHSSLAVSMNTSEPLGLVHQDIIIRKKFHATNETRKKRLERSRESEKWLDGVRKTKVLFPEKNDITIVGDREADTFDLIGLTLSSGYNFVIRQSRNRSTEMGLISDAIENARPKGVINVDIKRNGNRKARVARVQMLSCSNVRIFSPCVSGRKDPPIKLNIVIAKEVDENLEENPLYWVLLTNHAVSTKNDCKKIIENYQARWIIEEFHKGLKTGCSIEKRQLTNKDAIENILGLFSVISIILLHLRFCAKSNCKSNNLMITDIQKEILCHTYKCDIKKITPKEILFNIAKLGGFLARKNDGWPGWITLIRGYMELEKLEQGYVLAMKLMGKR